MEDMEAGPFSDSKGEDSPVLIPNNENAFKKDQEERDEDLNLLNDANSVKESELPKPEHYIDQVQKKIVNRQLFYMGQVKQILVEYKKLEIEGACFLGSDLWKEFSECYINEEFEKDLKDLGKVPRSRKGTSFSDEFNQDGGFDIDNQKIIDSIINKKTTFYSATNMGGMGEDDQNEEDELNEIFEENLFDTNNPDLVTENRDFKIGGGAYNERRDYQMKLTPDSVGEDFFGDSYDNDYNNKGAGGNDRYSAEKSREEEFDMDVEGFECNNVVIESMKQTFGHGKGRIGIDSSVGVKSEKKAEDQDFGSGAYWGDRRYSSEFSADALIKEMEEM